MLGALGACSGDGGSPTAPGPSGTDPSGTGGSLSVQSLSTATQPEPGGFRVQVRMRVGEGLNGLQQTTQTGTAGGQVCVSGFCAERAMSSGVRNASCAGQFGETPVNLAGIWLDGDVVSVEFCARSSEGGRTFETTVSDGARRSNVVRTVCTPGGACLS
jgi:primosomal replication protein N